MFNRIMIPVDLAHADTLQRAIGTAGVLAKHYGASIAFVGATSSQPSAVAKSPEEYAEKLSTFATTMGNELGVPVESETLHLHDLSIDLNRALTRHADKIGADLIVMATHIPGVAEYVFGSHGGEIAQHAKMSVMLIRG